ncbi:Activin_recp domain-containing protein [Caenorhabditis elegans]|uniref:Activin_recp domain-containing protein n=1 Tax=Caenorhabditis elegans TaxID=6239 RepID=V6CLG7_CAEEL|nr:Activin_recp domain-containing protein [Caenorhabditis elegans]CDK13394.1 Activin_recp domain-containing protein [Caenorhabditis elegans]|eukprot:NP_001293717.1 Uncharacterized protein CELE_W03F8.6 [Caenorhabditis elegans]
MCNSSNGPN